MIELKIGAETPEELQRLVVELALGMGVPAPVILDTGMATNSLVGGSVAEVVKAAEASGLIPAKPPRRRKNLKVENPLGPAKSAKPAPETPAALAGLLDEAEQETEATGDTKGALDAAQAAAVRFAEKHGKTELKKLLISMFVTRVQDLPNNKLVEFITACAKGPVS